MFVVEGRKERRVDRGSGPGELPHLLAGAGLDLRGRPVPVEEARSLPTAWARKLGYAGRRRAFWEFRGVVRP